MEQLLCLFDEAGKVGLPARHTYALQALGLVAHQRLALCDLEIMGHRLEAFSLCDQLLDPVHASNFLV